MIRTASTGFVAAAVASVASAQQVAPAEPAAASNDIVVTAQRRAERQVDVPISITAIGADALSTANARQLSDIARVTPALRFDSQAAFVQPTIRGIGTSVTTSGGGSNVGIYVDGFYVPNPLGSDFSLLNVGSIQVLKGPQGTLFGRNTTGGAILVETAQPSFEASGEARLSYGRFNQWRAQGYVTGPLSDKVAIDIEGLYRSGDGWVRNIVTNSRKDGRHENWTLRTGLLFAPTDNASLLLRYTRSSVDDPGFLLTNSFVDPDLGTGAANFAPPSSFTTTPGLYAGVNPRFFRADSDIFQMTFRADLGFADFTSYSQYRDEKVDMSQDLDQIALTIFQLGLPVENKTWSQEFLLNSKAGGRLQWTAGLFFFQNTDTYRTFIDNNVATIGRIPLGGSSATALTFAGFADFTWQAGERLFLTAGGRLAHDRIDDAYFIPPFSGVQVPVSPAQSEAARTTRFTPRLVLRYTPDDNSSIYASYTQGYKAAILDVGGGTGNPVLPETVNAFEIGFKHGRRGLSFETAAFYYDYQDLQVSLFTGNPPSARLVNAASSEIYGIEGQLRGDITDRLQLNAAAAWTHARYKRFISAPLYARCPGVAGCGGGTSFFVVTGTDLGNVTMQRSPEFTANLGASWSAGLSGGELVLSGNLYYTSKFFFGPSGIQFPQDGYEQLSLRAQWTDPSDRFQVALWGDNVTDRRFVTQAQYNNFGIGAVWNQPVSYGIELGVKF